MGGASEYDFTIIAHTASVKAAASDLANLEPLQRYNAELRFYEKEKITKYAGKTDTPFVPLLISAGGYVTENSRDVLKKWRKVVPHYGILTRRISLGLIRARAAYFKF